MNKSKIEKFTKETKGGQFRYYASNKVYDCGDIVDIKSSKIIRTPKRTTQRIDKDHYVILETGEYKKCKRNTKRTANKSTLMNSFFTIKRIIHKNFCGSENETFITLTYSGSMFDTDRLQKDFKAFWRKIHRKYPYCEYLRIFEPHKNGSWHIHLLVKDTVNKFIPIHQNDLEKFWNNGNVHMESIISIDALSNYFIPSKKAGASEKAKKKYKRLDYYPAGFNNYSTSKGIVVPKAVEMCAEEIAELIEGFYLDFSQTTDIFLNNDDGTKKFLNKTAFHEYKRNDYSLNQNSQPELSGERREVGE